MSNVRAQAILRLKRIEGQVRGLERMVERDAPCADILTQAAAVTAAVRKVGLVIFQGYSDARLGRGGRARFPGGAAARRDFQAAVSRLVRWS